MSEQQGNYDIEQIKKEFSALRKYAAIQAASEDKIGVQKIYIDMTGDIKAAFVLDELVFYTLPRKESGKSGLRIWKDGVLWMAVSRTEWWDRKRLTPKQADKAIELLEKQNLIKKDYFRFNGQFTTHLRLNVREFFRVYWETLENENPPEDETDSINKDIDDLYKMLGIPNQVSPNGNTPSPNGNTASPNGELHNIPDASLTQPLNTGSNEPANFPLDWQIGHDEEVTPISEKDQFLKEAKDRANLIDFQKPGAGALAYAFMVARNIILPEKSVKAQRKAAEEMMGMGVKPEHVTAATKQLMESIDRNGKRLTITDLFSVSKTAIGLANVPEPAPSFRLPSVDDLGDWRADLNLGVS